MYNKSQVPSSGSRFTLDGAENSLGLYRYGNRSICRCKVCEDAILIN